MSLFCPFPFWFRLLKAIALTMVVTWFVTGCQTASLSREASSTAGATSSASNTSLSHVSTTPANAGDTPTSSPAALSPDAPVSQQADSFLDEDTRNASWSASSQEAVKIPSSNSPSFPGHVGVPEGAELVPYEGPVEHIFFHPLIVYPERAFQGDRLAKGYDDYFVTVEEFKKILEELYRNQYILVDIFDLFEMKEENGAIILAPKPLKLPPGKKPLVLSIDDMNYYTYMVERGNVFKLILNDRGGIATYSVDSGGNEIISEDNEIVPILDRFVAEHPDFSLNGAKGIIALTGYEGILGYRTHDPSQPDFEQQKAEVTRVVERLKENGWRFASHSYGHPDVKKIPLTKLKEDTLKWKREVEPLIGPTPLYIYPYGSSVPASDPKFSFLEEQGFHAFFGVGPKPYFKFAKDYLFMDRRHIDGIALKTQKERLRPLFDVEKVIDPVRPK